MIKNMDTGFLDYINWLAVFIAALAYFILGALWYSKLLFARKWMTYTNQHAGNAATKKGLGRIMFTSFILLFISSAGIAVVQAKLEIVGAMSGLKLGLLTGVCFGAVTVCNTYLYEKRPFGLYLINAGYIIAGNVLAGIIICSWA